MFLGNRLKKKEKKETLLEAIFLFFLFFAAVNAFNRFYYWLSLALISLFLSLDFSKRKKIPRNFWLVAGLGFCYIIFNSATRYAFTGLLKAILPAAVYLICYWRIEEVYEKGGKNEVINKILISLIVVVLGLAAHLIINYVYNSYILPSKGEQFWETRNPTDIWTKSIASATGQAAIACIIIAFLSAIILSPNKIIYKIFAIGLFAFILYYNLTLAGRTLILLSGISICIAYGYMILCLKEKRFKRIVLWMTIFFLVGIIIVVAIDLFGFRTMIINSNFYQRFFGEYTNGNLLKDSRMAAKVQYINLMLRYPFGNHKIFALVQEYAHDLYLDTLDAAGIFAMCFAVAFILSSLLNCYRCIKNSSLPFVFKSVFICFYIILNIEFFIEPIWVGMHWLFVFYCLFDGMINAFLTKLENKNITYLKDNTKKKVAAINMLDCGSTGKIMFQIATAARKGDVIYETYSPKQYYKKANNSNIKVGHFYYSNKVEGFLHTSLGKIFANNGCHTYIGTKKLIKQLEREEIDCLHLHNLHAFCINLPLLFKYIKKNNIKVVWTLHDCWTFTGHCAHFDMIGCDKWKTGCHDCPQYKEYPKVYWDNSKRMYQKKKNWFTGVKDLTLIVPSQWLANLTRDSFLKEYPVKVIPNGIDLSVFKSTESDFRKRYNIEDKYVILGVSFGWSLKKGLDVFLELAERLDEKYRIVLVGTNSELDAQLPENIISIPKTQNQRELAEIYTAADVFVNPTREDTFPTVNLEALACGTPVVTFETGGSPEALDKTCGVVVAKNDINAMQKEIERICEAKPYSKEACVMRAKQFDMNDKFAEYVAAYER